MISVLQMTERAAHLIGAQRLLFDAGGYPEPAPDVPTFLIYTLDGGAWWFWKIIPGAIA
jgi:hypothetical protein